MGLKRSVRLWGVVAVAVLLAVLIATREEVPEASGEKTIHPEVVRLLEQSEEMILQAESGRGREHFASAEKLLKEGLTRQHRGQEQLYTALGNLYITRTYSKTHAAPPALPDLVLELFRKALQINPRYAPAHLGMAKVHSHRRNYQAALAAVREALRLDPHNLHILTDRGTNLLHMGRYRQAEQALKAALQLARKEGDTGQIVLIQEHLGKALAAQKKYRLAERYLRTSATSAESPSIAACSYSALGEIYRATGNIEKFVKSTMRVADSEANRPDVQFNTAKTCYQHGFFSEAKTYIERALTLVGRGRAPLPYKKLRRSILEAAKPGPTETELKAAQSAFNSYRFHLARVHADRAMHENKNLRAMVIKGFLHLLEKQYILAGKLFREAARLDRRAPGPRVGLGHLAIVNKDYARARRLLEPAAARYNSSPAPKETMRLASFSWLTFRMACQGMGWLLSNQNRYKKAMVYFDRILSESSNDIFALLGKGNSLNALKRFDAAQKHMEMVLEQDPFNRYALAELALVHFNKGQLKDAEKLFRAALAQAKGTNYTCPYEGLGLVYLRSNRPDLAKASFRRAIEINPNIEFKKYNGLAKIMIKEGKYEKARKLLRKSMENFPHDQEAPRLLKSIQKLAALK